MNTAISHGQFAFLKWLIFLQYPLIFLRPKTMQALRPLFQAFDLWPSSPHQQHLCQDAVHNVLPG
jgi:hypothetical protein